MKKLLMLCLVTMSLMATESQTGQNQNNNNSSADKSSDTTYLMVDNGNGAEVTTKQKLDSNSYLYTDSNGKSTIVWEMK